MKNFFKTPQEWCDQYGIGMLDPDGWRRECYPPYDYPRNWGDLISEEEFNVRVSVSTISGLANYAKYRAAIEKSS